MAKTRKEAQPTSRDDYVKQAAFIYETFLKEKFTAPVVEGDIQSDPIAFWLNYTIPDSDEITNDIEKALAVYENNSGNKSSKVVTQIRFMIEMKKWARSKKINMGFSKAAMANQPQILMRQQINQNEIMAGAFLNNYASFFKARNAPKIYTPEIATLLIRQFRIYLLRLAQTFVADKSVCDNTGTYGRIVIPVDGQFGITYDTAGKTFIMMGKKVSSPLEEAMRCCVMINMNRMLRIGFLKNPAATELDKKILNILTLTLKECCELGSAIVTQATGPKINRIAGRINYATLELQGRQAVADYNSIVAPEPKTADFKKKRAAQEILCGIVLRVAITHNLTSKEKLGDGATKNAIGTV